MAIRSHSTIYRYLTCAMVLLVCCGDDGEDGGTGTAGTGDDGTIGDDGDSGGSTDSGGTATTTAGSATSSAGEGTSATGNGWGPDDPPYEECFSKGGECEDPTATCLSFGDLAICAPACASVEDCPPGPPDGLLICTADMAQPDGLCQFSCYEASCPEGMICESQMCRWPKG